MLWVFATILASVFQVGRNALQRGVMTTAGPWVATLVRFLFGLPFSLLFVAVAGYLVPGARPSFGAAFWTSALAGAACQVLATAALLVSMHRAGFATGTALQQSSLPLAALLGFVVYGDRLGAVAWAGVGVTTVGLAVLSWPARIPTPTPAPMPAPGARAVAAPGAGAPHAGSGAAFGLLSGLLFGFALNAFRHAALALEGRHPVFAAIVSLCVVQLVQSAGLGVVLWLRAPAALGALGRTWRRSLGAGLCGSLASAGWFVALALSPAAPVRALGIVEAPLAALAGRRLFRETLGARQVVGGLAVLGGVVMTSLG